MQPILSERYNKWDMSTIWKWDKLFKFILLLLTLEKVTPITLGTVNYDKITSLIIFNFLFLILKFFYLLFPLYFWSLNVLISYSEEKKGTKSKWYIMYSLLSIKEIFTVKPTGFPEKFQILIKLFFRENSYNFVVQLLSFYKFLLILQNSILQDRVQGESELNLITL